MHMCDTGYASLYVGIWAESKLYAPSNRRGEQQMAGCRVESSLATIGFAEHGAKHPGYKISAPGWKRKAQTSCTRVSTSEHQGRIHERKAPCDGSVVAFSADLHVV